MQQCCGGSKSGCAGLAPAHTVVSLFASQKTEISRDGLQQNRHAQWFMLMFSAANICIVRLSQLSESIAQLRSEQLRSEQRQQHIVRQFRLQCVIQPTGWSLLYAHAVHKAHRLAPPHYRTAAIQHNDGEYMDLWVTYTTTIQEQQLP